MNPRVGVWLLACALACGKAATPAPTPVVPAVAEPPAPDPAPEATGQWQLAPVEVRVELPPDQDIAGLDEAALTTLATTTLRAMPQVLSVEPTLTTYLGPTQAGLHIEAAWQLVDADQKPRSMHQPATDGALALVVTVHAEQAQARGKGEAAQHVVRATLPLSAERHEAMDEFVRNRLQRALETAAQHALGELWARGLTDDQVIKLLKDEADWRQTAATREVGERKLLQAVADVEKLAGSSKRDVALVAVATLGRLGQVRSVPVLRSAADARHLDVVEAALQALLDMPGPEAHAALEAVATDHADDPVGKRARALLDAPAPPP